MNGIKYTLFTDKSIRLLVKNQYTSNVELGSICQPWGSRLSEKSVAWAREAHLGEWNPRQH
ncbi:hypothetical protein Lal_00031782 [Lupinus albus]|nr:hypothetical protein Lal_00031782 [Lupinus albus]